MFISYYFIEINFSFLHFGQATGANIVVDDSDEEMERIRHAPTLELGGSEPEDSASDVKTEAKHQDALDAILAANKTMMEQLEKMKMQNHFLEQQLIAATGAEMPQVTPNESMIPGAQPKATPVTSPEAQRQIFSPPPIQTPVVPAAFNSPPPPSHGVPPPPAPPKANPVVPAAMNGPPPVPSAPPALASEAVPPQVPAPKAPAAKGPAPAAASPSAPHEGPPAADQLKDGEQELAAEMDLEHEDASIVSKTFTLVIQTN